MINLDPDVVRVSERGNPPLQGNYTLWVGAQPTHITLFGLLSHPDKQPFMPGRDVASYLDGQSRLSVADRSFASGYLSRRAHAKSTGRLLEQTSR